MLEIEWPKDIEPSQSTQFESLARFYRYRVLGEACMELNLRELVLAHHEDDQYETIIMRLAHGHRGLGLLGMKPNMQIPECYGMYGVHDSGAVGETFREGQHTDCGVYKDHRESSIFGDLTKFPCKPASSGSLGQMQLENGGIRVLRPLLQYNKERLIATCLEDDTPWFEDHTNADPTLTARNSVRHIYKKHSLPPALRKDAIIALSTKWQRKKDTLNSEVLLLLNHCSIRAFEPRTGTVIAQFPNFISSEIGQAREEDNTAIQHQRELASTLLRYAISIVKPNEHVPVTTLGPARDAIFPELSQANMRRIARVNTFTVAGVLFQRKELQDSHVMGDATSGINLEEQKRHKDLMPMQDEEWFLSRQPHQSKPERHSTLEFPPQSAYNGATDGWKLYDGRYWIRISNHTTNDIRVRHLQAEDLQPFTATLKTRIRKIFKTCLKTMAPGKVRFTLPVIELAGAGPRERGLVLAVPTFDVSIPDAKKFMKYEIRYKKVEWPGLQEFYLYGGREPGRFSRELGIDDGN